MTKARTTKEARMLNGKGTRRIFGHSDFVIPSALDIRHSSFFFLRSSFASIGVIRGPLLFRNSAFACPP
ncbi:MAG: hypothetical protein DMF28_09860 [Verrucomicrobia bacterium]|nr:MAG: hypothetical protein DMF28_09860 [Verrucomicrobiota bacterium]